MAIVGLKMVTVALVDDNQKLIKGAEGLSETGLVEIDDSMFGTKTANITNLEGSVTKVPGNNKVQDVYMTLRNNQLRFPARFEAPASCRRNRFWAVFTLQLLVDNQLSD